MANGRMNCMLSDCRAKVERYMQWVFAGSAVTLFVPVLFHNSNTEDASDIDMSTGACPCPCSMCI